MAYCPDCASPIEAGQPACPRCGRQLAVAPAVPAPRQSYAKWAAILILISCAISLVSLVRFLFLASTSSGLGAVAGSIISMFLWIVWLVIALFIWRGQTWARWAALVLVLWNGLTLAMSMSRIHGPIPLSFSIAIFIPLLRIVAIVLAFL